MKFKLCDSLVVLLPLIYFTQNKISWILLFAYADDTEVLDIIKRTLEESLFLSEFEFGAQLAMTKKVEKI
ncbi:hypothetical protein Lal_00037844 [Lupinus albus]|nr:hypothetical protein Lal_00037844 [Lupinus albus]